MADPQRRPVPATLNGTIEGAPAGSEIKFAFAGQPGGTYMVPPDASNAPCGGMPVNLREDYVIPPNNEAEDSFSIKLNSPCEDPPEGTMVRLAGDVLARPGAPFHSPGELMHYVDTVLVVDTTAPLFLEGLSHSMTSPGSVQFDTVIRDDLTDAVAATLCCSVDGGPFSEIPMIEVPPVQSGEAIGFRASYQRASPSESNLNCHVRAIDEFGNVRESNPLNLSLQPLQVRTPWILTSGVFSGAQLFSTGDGTLPEQIMDANNEVTGASGNVAGPDACSCVHYHGLLYALGDPNPFECGWGCARKASEATPLLLDLSEAIHDQESALSYTHREDLTAGLKSLQASCVPLESAIATLGAALGDPVLAPADQRPGYGMQGLDAEVAEQARRKLESVVRLNELVRRMFLPSAQGEPPRGTVFMLEYLLATTREGYDLLAAEGVLF